MPDAGFANSAGAKGGLVPLALLCATLIGAFLTFIVTVVLAN